MKYGPALLTVFVLVAAAAPARADVRLLIVDMDPGPTATLDHWERFSLRIEYQADRAIRIHGDAYFEGRRVTAINAASPRYESGEGEALLWFAWTSPTSVDRIVARAADDATGAVLAEAERPVRLTATGRRSERRRRDAAWVTRLLAEQDAQIGEQVREIRDLDPSPWADYAFVAMLWSAPVYLLLQGVALWRMRRGWWRIAALVPAVPMGFVFAFTVLGMIAGASLFPLVLMFTSPPAALYLVILLVAHGAVQHVAGR